MGGMSLTRLKHGRDGHVTCCESTPSLGQGRGARLHRAEYSKGARGMLGAGREKTLRCRRCSCCAVRSTCGGGGSSNQRASLCAALQGAPDHCSQLDRLLSGRSYRWKLRRQEIRWSVCRQCSPKYVWCPDEFRNQRSVR